MNLQQTLNSLEYNKIAVALDIGVHHNCELDSNCPVAIELRKAISQSGITLEQLLEGYNSFNQPELEPIPLGNLTFDGKVVISIAGQTIPLDLTEVIESQISREYRRKREELYSASRRLREVGLSLYHSYLDKIEEARNSKTLPQLKFNKKELIEADCLITSEGENYLFLFRRVYCPESIIASGVRYALSQEDRDTIKRNVLFVKFPTLIVDHDILFRHIIFTDMHTSSVLPKLFKLFCILWPT